MSEYGTGADGDPIEEEEILGHLEPSGDVAPRPQRLVRTGHDFRHRLWRVGERLLVPAIPQRGAVELEQPIGVQPFGVYRLSSSPTLMNARSTAGASHARAASTRADMTETRSAVNLLTHPKSRKVTVPSSWKR